MEDPDKKTNQSQSNQHDQGKHKQRSKKIPYSDHYTCSMRPDELTILVLEGVKAFICGETYCGLRLSDLIPKTRTRKHMLAGSIPSDVYNLMGSMLRDDLINNVEKRCPIAKPNVYVSVNVMHSNIVPLPKKHDVELLAHASIIAFCPMGASDKNLILTMKAFTQKHKEDKGIRSIIRKENEDLNTRKEI